MVCAGGARCPRGGLARDTARREPPPRGRVDRRRGAGPGRGTRRPAPAGALLDVRSSHRDDGAGRAPSGLRRSGPKAARHRLVGRERGRHPRAAQDRTQLSPAQAAPTPGPFARRDRAFRFLQRLGHAGRGRGPARTLHRGRLRRETPAPRGRGAGLLRYRRGAGPDGGLDDPLDGSTARGRHRRRIRPRGVATGQDPAAPAAPRLRAAAGRRPDRGGPGPRRRGPARIRRGRTQPAVPLPLLAGVGPRGGGPAPGLRPHRCRPSGLQVPVATPQKPDQPGERRQRPFGLHRLGHHAGDRRFGMVCLGSVLVLACRPAGDAL